MLPLSTFVRLECWAFAVYAAVALSILLNICLTEFDVVSHRHLRLAIHWSMITLGSGLGNGLSMSASIEWSGSVEPIHVQQTFDNSYLSRPAGFYCSYFTHSKHQGLRKSCRGRQSQRPYSGNWENMGFRSTSWLYPTRNLWFHRFVTIVLPLNLPDLGIVLFGLILTRTLQSFQGQSLRALMVRGSSTLDASADWILPMLVEIGKKFAQGQSISTQELARRLSISSDDTAKFGDILVENDLAHYLDSAERRLALSRPAEAISICEVIDLTHRMSHARQHRPGSLGHRDPESQLTKTTNLLEPSQNR